MSGLILSIVCAIICIVNCVIAFVRKMSLYAKLISIFCAMFVTGTAIFKICNYDTIKMMEEYEQGPIFSDVPEKAHVDTITYVDGGDTIYDYRLEWNYDVKKHYEELKER